MSRREWEAACSNAAELRPIRQAFLLRLVVPSVSNLKSETRGLRFTADLRNSSWPSRFDALFSQTTEYALRVMIHLASLSTPATTKEIAVATKVPLGYLSKVIQ